MSCHLVEAESFEQHGGWVVDQQFMDLMGSPFLMAHGLGEPVANARTQVQLPDLGRYRVWIRTRDWVAPQGPGRFRVRLNGDALAPVFGLGDSGCWEWHDGGIVEIHDNPVRLELEDLTGFNARCDAILFCSDLRFVPPNDGKQLDAFRREARGLPDVPPDAGMFDFVVAGGGYAGVCAAVAASRLGLKTALVQDRPVLGGNASSEVRVGPIGGFDVGPYPRNADVIRELLAAPDRSASSGGIRPCPDDQHVADIVLREENLKLYLNTHINRLQTTANRIAAVHTVNTLDGTELRFAASLFADCTGDAQLGALAGADWRMGREGRDEMGESLAPPQADATLLGVSNYWLAKHTDAAHAFPDCPWALRIERDEMMEVSTPKWPPEFGDYAYAAGWNWETGFTMDQLNDAESVRDHNLRAIFGAWNFLKNRSSQRDDLQNASLDWVGYIMGKRESRRLMGDHILTQQDIQDAKVYPDACVTATWYFDLHFPHPQNSHFFPGREFRSLAFDDPNFEQFRGDIPGEYMPIDQYPIPFRCFYSRNRNNLFMAGRNVSATHAGLAPIRVMNTTAMMGTVVGRAAALCERLCCGPRELYEQHLDRFKQLLAEPTPAYLESCYANK